jgi:excinuclease ABC subunit C
VTEQCLDIICAAPLDTGYLIQLTIYKDSMIESQRDYHFPEFTGLPSDLIEQFLFQLYSPDCHLSGRIAAKTILLDVSLIEVSTISATVLSSLGIQKRVKLAPTTKNERTFWHSARTNVDYAIARYISQQSQYSTQFSLLAQSFLDADWAYIDCVDISHLQGQHTTASCVRFSVAGAEKSSFRAYSLDTGNDDYASMRAFIHRRYQGARQLAPANLLLIDGGLGQLSAIQKAFVDIKHPNPPHLLAICKAPGRRSGEEKYYTTTATDGAKSLDFPETVTRLLENIRDHAHRFAITRQRKKQLKASLESCLHAVPGLGNYRITQLLHYFGSFEVLTQASIEQIQQVPGISKNLAERIYNLLHKS